ncbi:MAG: hypothetical protein VW268_11255 [Rhodospirillaceae bacterium]
MIVCRTYAKPLLELVHLVAAADRTVLEALNSAHGVGLHPLGFLNALHLRSAETYGPYAPRLRLADWLTPFCPDLTQSAEHRPGNGNR